MKKYNIKELEEKLKTCKDIDLSEVDIDEVDDLDKIKISRKKSKEKRIIDFITKNPYIFKVNGRLVLLIMVQVQRMLLLMLQKVFIDSIDFIN